MKKGKLSEQRLISNGIEFDTEVEKGMDNISKYFLSRYSSSQQAWVVTEGLLDFDSILSPSNFVGFINPKIAKLRRSLADLAVYRGSLT